jgi:hypothetical protein
MRRRDTEATEDGGWDGSIYQSKVEQVARLQELLVDVEHTEEIRYRDPRHLPAHIFRLRRAYVSDLWERSGLPEHGPEAFVLALSPEQRTAWLEVMIDGEGNLQSNGEVADAEGRAFVRISQADGPLQDAIAVAVYLSGWRPSYNRLRRCEDHHAPAGHVNLCRPHVAPSMFEEPRVRADADVWCVTTKFGTWTARQGGLVFLTGNTIGPTFEAYKLPGRGNIRNPVDNAAAAIEYMFDRYGHIVGPGPGGYAFGGRMPDWGGSFARGGRARYRRPTMIQVGDGTSPETVEVTPDAGRGRRSGGLVINFHKGSIMVNGTSERAAQSFVDQVMTRIAAAVEKMGLEEEAGLAR